VIFTRIAIDSKCILHKQCYTCSNIQSPSPKGNCHLVPVCIFYDINFLFQSAFFKSVLQSAPKVERSNVSCKASGQFWLMHRGATKFPCVQIPFLALLSFNQGEERDQDWSLNGFSTIPSTKVFWSKGLNKSTKNMNRNNKYQNQHVID